MAANFSRTFIDLTTKTLTRKCITGAVISSTGDSISQHIVEKKPLDQHDFFRTSRLAFHSAFVFIPILNTWFRVLGSIEMRNKVLQTATRVVCDQLIGGPSFTAIFYTSLTLLEGGSFEMVRQRLRQAWLPTLSVGFFVFTPASIINMSVIPPNNRVLFMNSVSLGWNVFLSYSNNKNRLLSEQLAIKDAERSAEGKALQAPSA